MKKIAKKEQKRKKGQEGREETETQIKSLSVLQGMTKI